MRSTCCTMNGGDPMSEKSKKLRLTNSIDRRRLCLLSTKPTSTFVDSRGNGIKFRPLSSNAERRDRERKGSMLLKKLVADLVEKREEEREREKEHFLGMEGLYWRSWLPLVMAGLFPFAPSHINSFSWQPTTLIVALFYIKLGVITCTRVLLKAEFFPLGIVKKWYTSVGYENGSKK
jgi:hypothetical protein